jgi:hypothetical protein
MEASVLVCTITSLERVSANPLKSLFFRSIPLLLSFLLLFSHGRILAQEPFGKLKVSVDTTEINIGDIVTVSLTIQYPSSTKVSLPPVGNLLGEWTVRNVKNIPAKSLNNDIQEVGLQIQLAIYKIGEFNIPAMEVELIKKSGEREVLGSAPIKIKVESILAGQKQELKDLKAQAEITPDYRPFLLLLAALASAVFLIYWLFATLRKRRKVERIEVLDTRTPEQIARDAIQALLSRRLVTEGLLKQFYLELSEIVKRYIGQKLNILSLERTTEEFNRDLRKTSLPLPDFEMIREFLIQCDLVKFAKYHPSPEEIQSIIEQAVQLIDSIEASQNRSSRELEVTA